MERPFISFTSDFGVQSQGVGIMEAVALTISPEAHIIHLMHGLPDFDITCAARTLETVCYLPVGFHVCVVDPEVGTKRKPIIIQTKRADYLIGPDNGVLIPATHFLGEATKVVEISNPQYMRHPVSPIFHGRDIFAPAAAYLSTGIRIEEFGQELQFQNLTPAPYQEAILNQDTIEAQVIHINKYGSLHLNILNSTWDTFMDSKYNTVVLHFSKKKLEVPYKETFGDVAPNTPLILKDDYGRVEVAINMGNFANVHNIKVGTTCRIQKK